MALLCYALVEGSRHIDLTFNTLSTLANAISEDFCTMSGVGHLSMSNGLVRICNSPLVIITVVISSALSSIIISLKWCNLKMVVN